VSGLSLPPGGGASASMVRSAAAVEAFATGRANREK